MVARQAGFEPAGAPGACSGSWHARQDSNPPVLRGLVRGAGTPGRIRTCDPWLRRPLLYPLSYWRAAQRGYSATTRSGKAGFGAESLANRCPAATALSQGRHPSHSYSGSKTQGIHPPSVGADTATRRSARQGPILGRCPLSPTERPTASQASTEGPEQTRPAAARQHGPGKQDSEPNPSRTGARRPLLYPKAATQATRTADPRPRESTPHPSGPTPRRDEAPAKARFSAAVPCRPPSAPPHPRPLPKAPSRLGPRQRDSPEQQRWESNAEGAGGGGERTRASAPVDGAGHRTGMVSN